MYYWFTDYPQYKYLNELYMRTSIAKALILIALWTTAFLGVSLFVSLYRWFLVLILIWVLYYIGVRRIASGWVREVTLALYLATSLIPLIIATSINFLLMYIALKYSGMDVDYFDVVNIAEGTPWRIMNNLSEPLRDIYDIGFGNLMGWLIVWFVIVGAFLGAPMAIIGVKHSNAVLTSGGIALINWPIWTLAALYSKVDPGIVVLINIMLLLLGAALTSGGLVKLRLGQ